MEDDAYSLKKTLDNPYFVALSRFMMVISTCVILPAALWMGARFITTVDKITDKVNEINVTVQETNVTIKGLQYQIGDIKFRVDDHEGRIRVLERPTGKSSILTPPG